MWLAVGSALVMLLVPTVAIATHTEAGLFSRPPGHLLAMTFCAGVCLFYFRYRIPFSLPIFIACLALSLLLFMRAKSGYLAVIPISYVTIYLGLQHPAKYGFMKRADLSYGVYLYGCVMQQMVISLFPAMRVWWINWAVSLCLALACAAGSWYLVESQVLRRKRQIIARLLSPWTSTPAVVADRNTSSPAAYAKPVPSAHTGPGHTSSPSASSCDRDHFASTARSLSVPAPGMKRS
jgi:peptidoglycan/LPS O-acetylase OafA/YrhL